MQRPEIVHDPAILAEPQVAHNIGPGLGDACYHLWSSMHLVGQQARDLGVPSTIVVLGGGDVRGQRRFAAVSELASADLRADRVLLLTPETMMEAYHALGSTALDGHVGNPDLLGIAQGGLQELLLKLVPRHPSVDTVRENPHGLEQALYVGADHDYRRLCYQYWGQNLPIVTISPLGRAWLSVETWDYLMRRLLDAGFKLLLVADRKYDERSDHGRMMFHMIEGLRHDYPKSVIPQFWADSIFEGFAAADAANITLAVNTWTSWPFTAHRRHHVFLWGRPDDWHLSIPAEVKYLTMRHEFGPNLYLRLETTHRIGGHEGRAVADRIVRYAKTVPTDYVDPEPPALRPTLGEDAE